MRRSRSEAGVDHLSPTSRAKRLKEIHVHGLFDELDGSIAQHKLGALGMPAAEALGKVERHVDRHEPMTSRWAIELGRLPDWLESWPYHPEVKLPLLGLDWFNRSPTRKVRLRPSVILLKSTSDISKSTPGVPSPREPAEPA